MRLQVRARPPWRGKSGVMQLRITPQYKSSGEFGGRPGPAEKFLFGDFRLSGLLNRAINFEPLQTNLYPIPDLIQAFILAFFDPFFNYWNPIFSDNTASPSAVGLNIKVFVHYEPYSIDPKHNPTYEIHVEFFPRQANKVNVFSPFQNSLHSMHSYYSHCEASL